MLRSYSPANYPIPYAAPFEFCLSASARAVQLGVAAQVDPHTQKKARLMPGPMRAMRTA